MALIRYATAAALIGILVTANFAMLKQFENNGSWNLDTISAYSNRILPNTNIPISIPKTGIPGLDNYFAFMTAFFYTAHDTRNVRAHIQGNHLLGTLSSIWIVMLTEAHDGGGVFFGLTYFLEFMGELLGIGIFTPIWCLAHVGMRSGKSSSPATTKNTNLRALGYALLVGHVAPTYLMLATQPDGQGVASQQLWTVTRLFHPALVFGAYRIISAVLPSTTTNSTTAIKRTFYTFSILASAFFHVTSVGYLLAPILLPGWVREEIALGLDWKTVIFPISFTSTAPISWETAVAMLLQWDYTCSSAAVVVWSLGLYAESVAGSKEGGLWAVLETVGQSVLVTILAGPAAAAAWLTGEKDRVVEANESRISGGKKNL